MLVIHYPVQIFELLLDISGTNILIGAFGSGATFAMEDGWILARALEHSQFASHPVEEALEVFNVIRSPYYARMWVAKMDRF